MLVVVFAAAVVVGFFWELCAIVFSERILSVRPQVFHSKNGFDLFHTFSMILGGALHNDRLGAIFVIVVVGVDDDNEEEEEEEEDTLSAIVSS